MNRRLPLAAGLVLAALSSAVPARAQIGAVVGEPPDLADRVVAVVGDSVILLSEIQREVLLLETRGAEVPSDSAGRRQAMRDILENLVDLQLILQEAARDSTLVPAPDLIGERVEAHLENLQTQLGSARALQEALAEDGLTLAEYRDDVRSQIRSQQIQQLFLQRRLAEASPVVVTEAEMLELYEAQKTQLQARPELLTLEQILIRPSPPDSAWAVAKAEADSLVAVLRGGAEFATVAEESSDDPGSAANGGDLGWFRRGNMVREFEEVAFRLPDRQISDPVRSEFGWHIIRVDRSRPGEVRARHILIRPESSPEDVARARTLAAALADSVRAGVAVDELKERHGDDERTWRLEVSRDQINTDLPEGYGPALASAREGQVLDPFEIRAGTQTAWAVVKVAEIREAGEFTFEDLRTTIRQRMQEQKKLERLREQLRASAYIDIRF